MDSAKINIELDRLNGIMENLPENLKSMIRTEVNQAMAVHTLEHIVIQIKCAFIEGNTVLPFIPYIRHNIDKIRSETELAYIIELLHECWLIINPWYKINTNMKLSDEDALDAALSQYSGGDKINESIELGKDPYLAMINISNVAKDKIGVLHTIYSKYLEDIKVIIVPKIEMLGYRLLNGFTLDRTIVSKKFSRKQIAAISAYLINAGYITQNDEQAFWACFQHTLHTADHKIKWLGRNPRNSHVRSLASLYCLFENLGVDMADDKNRKKVSALFEDCFGAEISY